PPPPAAFEHSRAASPPFGPASDVGATLRRRAGRHHHPLWVKGDPLGCTALQKRARLRAAGRTSCTRTLTDFAHGSRQLGWPSYGGHRASIPSSVPSHSLGSLPRGHPLPTCYAAAWRSSSSNSFSQRRASACSGARLATALESSHRTFASASSST